MTLRLPEARDAMDVAMDDGAVIRVRRHGNPQGPRVVVSHGNGFAVDAYLPFWALLLDEFDVVLFDLRNHGCNPRHRQEGHDLPRFVEDFERLAVEIPRRWGVKPCAAVFHSISAITALRQALERGWRWGVLVCVDPPLIPSPGHRLYDLTHDFEVGLARWARTRRGRFESPDALAAVLSGAQSRRRWVEGAHALMARSVLRRDAEANDWELCCPGPWEARIYASNAALDICPQLSGIEGPVLFVGADPSAADAWPPARINRALHEDYRHPYRFIPDTSHMIHVERPEALAAEVQRFLARNGIEGCRS